MYSVIVVIALLFSCVVALFALQNSDPIAIKFLFWTFHQVPLVIIMFGSALFGAFVTFAVSLRKSLGTRLKIRELNKRLEVLEKKSAAEQMSINAALPKASENAVIEENPENKEGGTNQK